MQRKVKTAKPGRQPEQSPEEPDGLWKKPKVCQTLSISPRTVSYRVKDGTIPHVRIGGAVRFVPEDIRNLIKFSRVGGKIRKGGTSPQ
jgi:predicted DNA-binding transcriptional regulator AlpA